MISLIRCLEYLPDTDFFYYMVQQEAGAHNLCSSSNSWISYGGLLWIQTFRWLKLSCLRINLANTSAFTSRLLFFFIPKGNAFINIGHTIFLVLDINTISHVLTPHMIIIITMFRAKVKRGVLYYLLWKAFLGKHSDNSTGT